MNIRTYRGHTDDKSVEITGRRVIHGWEERKRERVEMIKHGGRRKTRSCSKVSRVGRKLAVMYDGTGREKWKTQRGRKRE